MGAFAFPAVLGLALPAILGFALLATADFALPAARDVGLGTGFDLGMVGASSSSELPLTSKSNASPSLESLPTTATFLARLPLAVTVLID